MNQIRRTIATGRLFELIRKLYLKVETQKGRRALLRPLFLDVVRVEAAVPYLLDALVGYVKDDPRHEVQRALTDVLPPDFILVSWRFVSYYFFHEKLD